MYVFIVVEHNYTFRETHTYAFVQIVKDVTGGKVDIDLSIMGMIKIKKQLDLCDVLGSDIMGHQDCPLAAGDLELDALGISCILYYFYCLKTNSDLKIAWIPKELPKLPLEGNIRISDQYGSTVTCIHLNFRLQ